MVCGRALVKPVVEFPRAVVVGPYYRLAEFIECQNLWSRLLRKRDLRKISHALKHDGCCSHQSWWDCTTAVEEGSEGHLCQTLSSIDITAEGVEVRADGFFFTVKVESEVVDCVVHSVEDAFDVHLALPHCFVSIRKQ